MDLGNSEFLYFINKAYQNRLEYILIGGLALNLNGINRHTQDADIWIKPTDENKKAFLQTLLDIDYTEEEIEDIADQDFKIPQAFTIAGPIDILTFIHQNIDFNECFKHSKSQLIDNININVLHLNDLREAKILARRPQDLRDVILIDDFLKNQE